MAPKEKGIICLTKERDVEQFMVKMEVAVEMDADLNRASKPAIEKLKMLSELWTVLHKQQLQLEFLERGVLASLRSWLEPLPDGSLPNVQVRSTVLQLLADLPLNVEFSEPRKQLKRSGLGKAVMFLSHLPDETLANKKLARVLVEKWSRRIFHRSDKFQDLRAYDAERPLPLRTKTELAPVKRAIVDGGDDLDMLQGPAKKMKPSGRVYVEVPLPMPLGFVRRPPSKRALKQKHEIREGLNMKLLRLKKKNKWVLQACKISVAGRGVTDSL